MPLCVKCNREVCNPCVRVTLGPQAKPRKIVVASDDELTRISYFQRLAVATARLKADQELSRREIPDWIADVIHGFEGHIVWAHGGVFLIADTAIDEAFNDDGSFRWLSGFINFAEEPPKQRPQFRVVRRLRLIDLAFRIDRPDIAQHFGR